MSEILPDQVQILGSWIDIKYVDEIPGSGEFTTFGDFCEVDNLIRIVDDTPENMAAILLHEIVHAMFARSALGKIIAEDHEEAVCKLLETLSGIYTLKKDSKLLRRKLRPSSDVSAVNLRQRKNAHQKVYYAIKTGKLTRPSVCSECGGSGKIHAHHEDYSQPLKVQFLCQKCHKKAHS